MSAAPRAALPTASCSAAPRATWGSFSMPAPVIETVGMIAKPRSEHAARILPDLVDWLTARGVKLRLDENTASYAGRNGALPRDEVPQGAQLVVVLGGD